MAEWEEIFSESYSVDFFSSSSGAHKLKARGPEYYGNNVPAYTMLGPRFCPVAFGSQKVFY